MAILHVSHAQTKTPLKLEFSDAGDHQTSRTCNPIRWNLRSIPPANISRFTHLLWWSQGFWLLLMTISEFPPWKNPPKRFGTAEVTHHVFSGVAMVAQRQLSEGPSNPPRKHTSRYSHCLKPVATKVMFGSSMVSYQLGNQETLESKLWSSGKSWPKCTLQPPRRTYQSSSIFHNIDGLSESKHYQNHINATSLNKNSACGPVAVFPAIRPTHWAAATGTPIRMAPTKVRAGLPSFTTEILYSSSSWRKTGSVRLSQQICETTGPYHLLC